LVCEVGILTLRKRRRSLEVNTRKIGECRFRKRNAYQVGWGVMYKKGRNSTDKKGSI
jgi:hypothetical protein